MPRSQSISILDAGKPSVLQVKASIALTICPNSHPRAAPTPTGSKVAPGQIPIDPPRVQVPAESHVGPPCGSVGETDASNVVEAGKPAPIKDCAGGASLDPCREGINSRAECIIISGGASEAPDRELQTSLTSKLLTELKECRLSPPLAAPRFARVALAAVAGYSSASSGTQEPCATATTALQEACTRGWCAEGPDGSAIATASLPVVVNYAKVRVVETCGGQAPASCEAPPSAPRLCGAVEHEWEFGLWPAALSTAM